MIQFNSCIKYKEYKIKEDFVGKTWIIDIQKQKMPSFIDSSGVGELYTNYILKPEKDYTIKVYKEQYLRFENFRIKGDTLFLNKETYESDSSAALVFKYVPYKYQRINDYSVKLIAYDINELDFEIYMTDITDLFNKTPLNLKSQLYNELKEYTWYPIKVVLSSSFESQTLIDDEYPDYYKKTEAFYIDNGKITFPSFINENNCVYKFTDDRIYVYDILNEEYIINYKAIREDKYLVLIGYSGAVQTYIKMKKIDHTLLKDLDELPKKAIYDCNKQKAKEILEVRLSESNNPDYYFDLETITLIEENANDCEYVFTVIYRNIKFSDIYKKVMMFLYTDDDGNVEIQQI